MVAPRVVDAIEVRQLERDHRSRQPARVVDDRQEERMQARDEPGVAVDQGLDILGVDVGAHDTDRGVPPAVDPQERQRDRRGPGQPAAGPGSLGRRIEPVDRVAEVAKHVLYAGERRDAALVVHVVADPRRQEIEPGHRADDLVLVVDLEEVDQRVVLEDHRQARVRSEQRHADVGTGAGEPAHGHAHGRFGGHPDLDVGGTVPRVHGGEPVEEQVTELLGHPLTSDEGMELVVGPREAAPLALVEEVLEERRIAGDQEAISSAEVREGRQDLVDVGADRLHDPVPHHPEAHVEAGRPRSHRERVDRDERPRAEGVARKERDVAMGHLPLAPAADPVVGRAG